MCKGPEGEGAARSTTVPSTTFGKSFNECSFLGLFNSEEYFDSTSSLISSNDVEFTSRIILSTSGFNSCILTLTVISSAISLPITAPRDALPLCKYAFSKTHLRMSRVMFNNLFRYIEYYHGSGEQFFILFFFESHLCSILIFFSHI